MRTTLAIASATLLALTGCELCDACPQEPLVAGSYASTRNSFDPMLSRRTPAGAVPWGPEPKTLELDVANRTVRLQYRRDGHDVVETWRVTALSQCPP
jgi:hypothetical protein